jgi:hypothetical protein
MTEEDLKHIERTANALASWGQVVQADRVRALIAEVRRLQSGIIPVSAEQSAEWAALMLHKRVAPPQNASQPFATPISPTDAGPYLTWHPDGTGERQPRYLIPLSACVPCASSDGTLIGYRIMQSAGYGVLLPLSELTLPDEAFVPHVVGG